MSKSNTINQGYWKTAIANCTDIKMIAIAAVITALRIVVKQFSIPIIPNSLYIEFSCYFDALGSMIYGPFLALISGAVSDTVGALLFPQGAYFFPYIFPEMLGSFIYALFLWNRKKVTVPRIILSRFTVNIICNIILNSLVMKLQYILYGGEKVVYLFSLLRISKNIIIFPLEGILIAIIIIAALPALKRLKLIRYDILSEKITAKNIVLVAVLFLISVALVLFYVFYLRDYLVIHNLQYI